MVPIAEYRTVALVWGGVGVDDPEPGVMQVFYKDSIPVMVDFLCPCGCGHRCPTHLLEKDKPKPEGFHMWSLSLGPNGEPTLSPSIRWLSGCKAHFNITNGKVVLHSDSGK